MVVLKELKEKETDAMRRGMRQPVYGRQCHLSAIYRILILWVDCVQSV